MKYTADQNNAISTHEENLQIIACAGSGKTQVIAERIVDILRTKGSQGINPGNIVAFTFTDKAAAELKDRIYRLCKASFGTDKGLGEMYVGTIHGYCLNLLQQPPMYKFLKYNVLSDIHQRLLIDRFSNESGLTNTPKLAGGSLSRWIDSHLYQQLIGICEESGIQSSKIPTAVRKAIDQYKTLCHKQRYLDFSTIISEALHAISSNRDLRNKIAASLRYLVVDEYQDVNPLQEALIEKLYSLGKNICVVGDDDQTIYQWRGSDVQNIITFASRYPKVKTIPFNDNFRSSPAIVEAARKMIEKIPARLPKAMGSTNAQPAQEGDVLALSFKSPEEEAKWIVSKIKTLLGTPYKDKQDADPRGITYSDMAVLLRSVRRDARPIVNALAKADIPFIVGGMDGLFDTLEVNAVTMAFFYLADFQHPKNGPIQECELRQILVASGLGLSSPALDAGINLLNERKSRLIGKTDAKLYIQRVYLDFLSSLNLREEDIDNSRKRRGSGEVAYYNLGKFSNVISDFEQINFHSKPTDLYASFANFLFYQAPDYYPEGWEDNGYARPDAVQIMTVHKAKGMQWPAVFIPCLRKNRFPSRRAGGRSVWHVIPENAVNNADRYKGTEEDERRLFYVALTRAERFLFCSWAPIASNQQHRKVSQFFRDFTDCDKVLTKDPSLPRPKPLPQKPRQEDLSMPLTFSELKYYFQCPYMFKLRFLYGFDAPVSRALGYGRSLHNALAEIHAKSLAGIIPTIADVPRLVSEHLHLPFANQQVDQYLRDSATEALTRYLNEHGKNLARLEHVEKNIELKLADGIVVNGRIDLIRRTDTNQLLVVDFKSDERAQAEDITQRQLHVYAVGYEQLTGNRADMIEIHNLDHGGATRELVDDNLTKETLETIETAGRSLRTNTLPRLKILCKTCKSCEQKGICRTS